MDNSVIMNDCVRLSNLELFRIETLNVPYFKFTKGQLLLTKVQLYGTFDKSRVGAVSCDCQTSLCDLKPFEQIISEQHISTQIVFFSWDNKFPP